MQTVFVCLHLLCRFIVAFLLFFHAAFGMIKMGGAGIELLGRTVAPNANTAICALLLAISIWIAFGIYTRVMTVLGGALFAGFFFILGGRTLFTVEGDLLGVLLIFASLPLLVFGGGSYSMLKKGWSLSF